MSKYTTEVRFICENYAGLQDSTSDYKTVIEKSRAKVFDFDFPIYDESYRSVLETKILKHFYTREIGFETVGLWKLWMDKRLNEIMPYYNQLYKSATLEFNPFYDFDYSTTSQRNVSGKDDKTSNFTRTDNLSEVIEELSTKTRTDDLTETTNDVRTDGLTEQVDKTVGSTRTDDLTKTTNGNTSGDNSNTRKDNTTVTTSNKNRYSDTPQGSLENIENNTYLTNATLDDGSNKTDGTITDTGKNSGKYDDTVKNTGTQTNNEITQGTKRNSGTQKNEATKKNTGTQNNNDSVNSRKDNTGNQKNDGTDNRVYSNFDDYVEHVAGKRNGTSYSVLLQEYRRTFLNIDMMIIDELNDLFMNLW